MSGQITDFVKSDSIIYQFTNQTLVKFFMEQIIALENFKETDFFQIKREKRFKYQSFLDKSLTNYLHLLSSQSTADELTKTGIINLHLLTAKKFMLKI
jgi:hypothetical protein